MAFHAIHDYGESFKQDKAGNNDAQVISSFRHRNPGTRGNGADNHCPQDILWRIAVTIYFPEAG